MEEGADVSAETDALEEEGDESDEAGTVEEEEEEESKEEVSMGDEEESCDDEPHDVFNSVWKYFLFFSPTISTFGYPGKA
jgi:hypothetical protein